MQEFGNKYSEIGSYFYFPTHYTSFDTKITKNKNDLKAKHPFEAALYSFGMGKSILVLQKFQS